MMSHDFDLISLDVTSLFTNIPSDLAIKVIKKRWSFISRNTKFTLDEFLIAINFILSSTFFKFENKIYKQTFGSPMSSPLSFIIVGIVMSDIELLAIDRLSFSLSIYFRYVDILTMVPQTYTDEIVTVFNSIHKRIQFTVEVGEDRSINFAGCYCEHC